MAELYTCYSPKGDKFELTRANYMDCVQHYGFTSGPASGVIPEAPAADDVDDTADPAPIADEPAPAADEPAADEPVAPEPAADEPAADELAPADDDEELDFDAMDKDTLKAFIRANFPEAEFDGRASRETLADLAFELVTKAEDDRAAAAAE